MRRQLEEEGGGDPFNRLRSGYRVYRRVPIEYLPHSGRHMKPDLNYVDSFVLGPLRLLPHPSPNVVHSRLLRVSQGCHNHVWTLRYEWNRRALLQRRAPEGCKWDYSESDEVGRRGRELMVPGTDASYALSRLFKGPQVSIPTPTHSSRAALQLAEYTQP